MERVRKPESGSLAYWWRVGLDQRNEPTLGPVSTWMGDRVQVQFPVRDILSRYVTSHPDQLSLAIPSWVGAMSTNQRAVRLAAEE